MTLHARGLVRTTLLVGALMLGVAAAAGPSRPVDQLDRWVAVGSTKNNANPSCNGVGNGTCSGEGSIKSFGLSLGQVPLMYPGSSEQLSVRFTNPEAFPIHVKSIEISKSLAVASEDCPLVKLVVNPVGIHTYSSPIAVPARASVNAPSITVGLDTSADSTCERASFTIRATATAVK